MKEHKKLLIIILILIILSPLGLILPELLNAGDAWGEWSIETVEQLIGYQPQGMKKLVDIYKAPIPDYSFTEKETSLFKNSIAYIISGIIGCGIILFITFITQKLLSKNDSRFS